MRGERCKISSENGWAYLNVSYREYSTLYSDLFDMSRKRNANDNQEESRPYNLSAFETDCTSKMDGSLLAHLTPLMPILLVYSHEASRYQAMGKQGRQILILRMAGNLTQQRLSFSSLHVATSRVYLVTRLVPTGDE